MRQYMLEAIDITKRFPGTIANDHVCLKVCGGEIMGLVGENGAGKSTILKCLNGIYPSSSYEGKICIEGKEVHITSPLDAMKHGIGFVPQEINVLMDMSVAENIFLFDLKEGGKLVNQKKLLQRAEKLLKDSTISLDPSANVRKLSVGQQQMLMIARALATNPKILILDEPTTSLSSQDVLRLFDVLRVLRAKGVAIIFVTHKLTEIMEMTDCLTVMRDGKNVGFYRREEYEQSRIVEDMIGRKLTTMYPKRNAKIGEEVLRIEKLSVPHPFILNRYLAQDISFSVRAGEVVGLAGLVGAGRSETVMGLFGELPTSGGTVYINGKQVKIRNCRDAIANGIGLVTEDRKKYGLHFSWSIKRNITFSNLRSIVNGVFISRRKEDRDAQKYFDSLKIKATSMTALVDSLSGGNQQKVVIGRSLNADPKIIILDEPTKGIDVGAKADIYQLINQLAQSGVAVLLISSEMPELMAMSDRFIVLAEGRVVGELSKEEATESSIMQMAVTTFKEIGGAEHANDR